MATSKTEFEQIRDRLDLIAHLLCLQVEANKTPAISAQIAILAEHGLTPTEIGRVIGREANYVSASLKTRSKTKKP